MHQGVLFWPTYGLKNAFHHFVLIGLLEQYTNIDVYLCYGYQNGQQNGLKTGKANILEQI